QTVVGVTTDLAHAIAALLGLLVDVPRELLATIVGQRRDRNPNHLAVVGWIEAEIRTADRLFNRPHQRRVEWLGNDERRLGNGERRNLIDRDLGPVGLDVNAVEQTDSGTAGADVGHVTAD